MAPSNQSFNKEELSNQEVNQPTKIAESINEVDALVNSHSQPNEEKEVEAVINLVENLNEELEKIKKDKSLKSSIQESFAVNISANVKSLIQAMREGYTKSGITGFIEGFCTGTINMIKGVEKFFSDIAQENPKLCQGIKTAVQIATLVVQSPAMDSIVKIASTAQIVSATAHAIGENLSVVKEQINEAQKNWGDINKTGDLLNAFTKLAETGIDLKNIVTNGLSQEQIIKFSENKENLKDINALVKSRESLLDKIFDIDKIDELTKDITVNNSSEKVLDETNSKLKQTISKLKTSIEEAKSKDTIIDKTLSVTEALTSFQKEMKNNIKDMEKNGLSSSAKIFDNIEKKFSEQVIEKYVKPIQAYTEIAQKLGKVIGIEPQSKASEVRLNQHMDVLGGKERGLS